VDPLGLVDCPGKGGCRPAVGEQDPAAKVGVDEGEPRLPVLSKQDKWSRDPKSLQDQMTLDSAKKGYGFLIIKDLKDPTFKGMEKWELKVKSNNRNDSVVHYVRDPNTGKLLDFKFKKHSVHDVKPWGNDPSVPPGVIEQ
ncbi:hypothetical protein, partial [Pseudomonas corrugata]